MPEHATPHSHNHLYETTASIRTAFFLNLGFTLVEAVGGVLTNSLAIVSDALHDLGDSLSIGFSWLMERQAHRPSQGRYSYGFRRLSLLAALVNAVVLIVGSLFILSRAVPRLVEPQHSNAGGMLALSILGILVNGAAVLRLRGGKTMNAQVIAWHLLEDVLGWVAVLIVSVSLLFTDLHILDPLLSILITCYVLYSVLRNLRRTVAIFLQAAPADLDVHAIEHELGRIPNVLSTHHTHAWSLDGEHHVLTTHLVVPAEAPKEVLVQVKRDAFRLMDQIDLEHTTIEIEYEDEDCRMLRA
jgi:cobalt-zinc-cadmium efflux system protein